MKRNQYPDHLIPKSDFPIISLIDDADYICRWVDGKIQLKESDGKLNPGAIVVERIPGFSTNKIPHSIPSDLYIVFPKESLEKYGKEWQPGIDGEKPDEGEYSIDDTRNYFLVRTSDINKYAENYQNPQNPDELLSFTVYLIHKPLVSNYWHFELSVKDAQNNEIKNAGAKWKKSVCSTIRSRMQDTAVFEI